MTVGGQGFDARFCPPYINAAPDSRRRMIHVCSLARLHRTVADTGARHVVSLMKDIEMIARPAAIVSDNHLLLGMDDITAPLEGYIQPADEHVTQLLAFVRRWERAAPLVIHCYAGISRSTAAAFVTACALAPSRDEFAIAHNLRLASPTATPNIRIVTLGDRALGRCGRMVEAIEAIGRGAMAAEADPFRLDLE
jgi:predicted protein tyrosine phosphatase